MFALIVASPSAHAARIGYSDTEPVVVMTPPGVTNDPLVDITMFLDFGAMPLSSYFADRTTTNTAEFLWDGSGNLTMAATDKSRNLSKFRGLAISELERYLDVYSDDATALMTYGVRLYQTNEIERSLLVFEKARAIEPQTAQIAELYSGVLVRAGDSKRAARIVADLLDAMPDNNVIRFNAACAYSLNGQVDECLYQLHLLAQLDWKDLPYYLGDRDLENVRGTESYKKLFDALIDQTRQSLNNLLLTSRFVPNL